MGERDPAQRRLFQRDHPPTPVSLNRNSLQAPLRSSPGLNYTTAKRVPGLSPSKLAIDPTRLQLVE